MAKDGLSLLEKQKERSSILVELRRIKTSSSCTACKASSPLAWTMQFATRPGGQYHHAH